MTRDLPMTEAQLQSRIFEICRDLGLLCYHTHDSRRSQPGYPDLTIAGPGGQVFAELKNAKHQATPEQERWLTMLRRGGAEAYLWRPEHLRSGVIAETLARLARPRGGA